MKRTSNTLSKVTFLEDYRLRKQFSNTQRFYAASAYSKNQQIQGSKYERSSKPFLAYDSKVLEKEEGNSHIVVISFIVLLLAFLLYAAFAFDFVAHFQHWRIETLSHIEQWIKAL